MASERESLPVFMAAVPLLAMQIGVSFVRFQARRKRGVRQFRSELIRGGMPKDQAARLAQAYHEAGSVRNIIRSARLPGA